MVNATLWALRLTTATWSVIVLPGLILVYENMFLVACGAVADAGITDQLIVPGFGLMATARVATDRLGADGEARAAGPDIAAATTATSARELPSTRPPVPGGACRRRYGVMFISADRPCYKGLGEPRTT